MKVREGREGNGGRNVMLICHSILVKISKRFFSLTSANTIKNILRFQSGTQWKSQIQIYPIHLGITSIGFPFSVSESIREATGLDMETRRYIEEPNGAARSGKGVEVG